MAEDVRTKARSHALWRSGAFGSKLRSWDTVEDYRRSGFGGTVVLRAREGGGGQFCRYRVRPRDVDLMVSELVSEGVRLDNVMVNEEAPDQRILLQGEHLNDVHLDRDGLPVRGFLLYSRNLSHMRTALARAPERAVGLRADLLLEQVMSPGSREDWLELLEEYPGHVLEVSVYDTFLGDVPRRNALVWEVRKY